jgi:hypothetical protein
MAAAAVLKRKIILKCSVSGCNSTSNDTPRLSFFYFPNDHRYSMISIFNHNLFTIFKKLWHCCLGLRQTIQRLSLKMLDIVSNANGLMIHTVFCCVLMLPLFTTSSSSSTFFSGFDGSHE